MKAIKLTTILALFFLIACSNNSGKDEISPDLIQVPGSASGKDTKKKAMIEFRTETHDFGKVKQGAKVSYAFKFTNTGKVDLIISNCVPSCGCTVPEFPRHPIKPGKSDFIKVVFDSKGRDGKFEKNISVFSNTVPNVRQLYIKGKVIK
jgi:hypothetical protein